MQKEWIIKKVSDKPVLDKLLELRGIVKPEDKQEFLNPLEFPIIPPEAFCDMHKAVDRIKLAIDKGEKILIYGDFDADGITSTSLLYKLFKHLGANVSYFIPEREKDGHGMNNKALVKLLTTVKPKLLITVDCGVSNINEVEFLKSFKVDVIITDHHEAGEVLPDAVAIINPKAPNKLVDSLTTKELVSLTSLAGVGVAFKLACALLDEYKKLDFVFELLPFVAVGTISDIVPLIFENRLFVTKGLELISNERHYGLKRLLEEAGYKPENGITSEQIAFGVTPRINATGRLEGVEDSVKVLISENRQEIELAIMSLNNCNRIRQELCESTFEQAHDMPQDENSIILFNKDWHVGIIGIVASKMVENFNKPAFLMTYSEETKQIRCSARGVPNLNIFDIMSANSELFDNFGGHAMAGGFAFSPEKTPFVKVKQALNHTINEMLAGKTLKPTLKIDLELTPDDINFDLISDIDKLQPFGAENPNPVFAMFNLKLLNKKLMGSNKNHLKLTVEDSRNNTYDCIWWSKGDISLNSGDYLDIAFCPQLNTFNGNTSLQFILQDIHSPKLVEEEIKPEFKVYDHRRKTGIFSSIEDYLLTTSLKVGVFAENQDIIAKLKSYPQIFKRIFNRTSEEKFDALMFFDYPCSQTLFDEIRQKTQAKIFHFMSYEPHILDEEKFVKTFYGMIKYSCNKTEGYFNIQKASAFLGIEEDVTKEILEAFQSVGVIKILQKPEYKLEQLSSEYAKILHSEMYSEIITEIKSSDDFKESFANADLHNFI
ncbi:MAG: single-stranded-DNA-specific exonuclease RecJ [Candidatus Melainabacteria bacterium]|nr:MAG: single-stranded-DNA-specific exonuclease RecJ [Candidatus Melainabacteria bacterium]